MSSDDDEIDDDAANDEGIADAIRIRMTRGDLY